MYQEELLNCTSHDSNCIPPLGGCEQGEETAVISEKAASAVISEKAASAVISEKAASAVISEKAASAVISEKAASAVISECLSPLFTLGSYLLSCIRWVLPTIMYPLGPTYHFYSLVPITPRHLLSLPTTDPPLTSLPPYFHSPPFLPTFTHLPSSLFSLTSLPPHFQGTFSAEFCDCVCRAPFCTAEGPAPQKCSRNTGWVQYCTRHHTPCTIHHAVLMIAIASCIGVRPTAGLTSTVLWPIGTRGAPAISIATSSACVQ
jgi:hypothetical protein